ncbi:NAD(P)-binding protein [Nemania sp. FL0916]|nr:NAD(P)-binding protein [Nemania sp. FL0916]
MSPPARRPEKPTVLVLGASGYLGDAVSRAFARAGWRVYGLVRRASAASSLFADEITPVIGSITARGDALDTLLADESTRPFDVVVSCTEQIPFDAHWAHILQLLVKVARHAGAEKGRKKKPLVLMSSGCKDYGTTARDREVGLAPHTEDSPLKPADIVSPRAFSALDVFEHKDLFDAAVIRPTPLFGYGGSYYGVLFKAMRGWLENGGGSDGNVLKVPGHLGNIYHGCHIDDCAEAYVALATHPSRAAVSGECFNISGYRYETVGEMMSAMTAEYGIKADIIAAPTAEVSPELRALAAGTEYSQWVDSSKIRELTGWTDRRELFSENMHMYRLAYEAAEQAGDSGVARIQDRVAGWAASGVTFQEKRAN